MKKYILILLIAFSANLFGQISFGTNSWNVYGYNHGGYNFANQMNLVGVTYRGFYTDASLDITSTSRWGSNDSPSFATGWSGSPVSTDNHTVVYKRQGFPCGTYEIDLDNHDDGVRCYVNGAQVYQINSCCADRGVIYTGYLDANSTVEFRVSEGGGGSNLFVDFDLISNTTSSANYVSGTSCNQYNINVAKPSGGSSPWFVSNLAEAAPNTQINGVATYVGNGCRLTPNSAGQYGSLAIDNPVGYNASEIDLNYDFYMGNGGGADGMSISYGSIPMNSNNGEFGSGTGVRIRMKTYSGAGPKVQLMYNNVVIATYGAFPWRNAQRACSLSIVDGRLTYIVAGTTVFNSVDLGASYLAANKTAWRWVFAARTGGISDDHYIYNLKIYAKEYEYSVGAGWQSSSTFSNLTGGNTYTVQARPKFSSSCITTVQTITLPNTTPTATTVSGGGAQCGGSITLSATGGSGGTIYFQGTTSNGTSTVTASTSETITSSGTYYFRAQTALGCWGAQGSEVVIIETAPTAPTSITGTTTICSGSSTSLTIAGGSDGSGATYQWYAGGCGSGSILGTGTSLSVSPISTTTYYVRRVGNTSCTNTSSCASQIVMVNGSAATPVLVTLPAVTAMVPVVTTTSTCIINDANWHHLYDANGDLLAAINSNGENLGSVAITIEVGNSGPFSTGLAPGVCGYPGAAAGEYALARNWEITVGNQPTIPVDVKFYYEASEVTDLTNTIAGLTNSTNYINCWGNVTSESDLMMTVSHTGGGTQLFPSITSTAGPGVGIREISFSLTEFSSGILHSNGGIHSANPLPVELLSFEAKPIDNEYIQINWITATEINNDGFELLRSKDGLSFEKIAWIKGNGNYSQKKPYSYNDTKVSSGTYYYKLRQIDFDGKFEDFNVISVSLSNKYESAEIVVRPIPTSNTITLDITSINNSKTVISVYNYSGQKVLELNKDFVKGENSLTIEEVSQLSSGIYYINLTLNNKVFTKKFVVSK